jgi:hypothetical protein
MLSLSDRPIEPVISFFAKLGVEAGYLVPTTTGLEKSILDAHAGLRDYFRLTKFHDYHHQAQGTGGKRVLQAFFVTATGLRNTQVSLYRPDTKTGDPRVWIYGLKDCSRAGNLLAVFVLNNALYVVNVSDRAMLSNAGEMHPVFDNLLKQIIGTSHAIAMELLDRLRDATGGAWISSMREGPTGVGFTLETLLGIAANNARTPDFKGIEIKAGRVKAGRHSSRTTLFSKTPDWSRSAVPNGLGLLDAYGYTVDKRLQLYYSLNNRPNSLGHYLEVQEDELILHSMHKPAGAATLPKKVLLWDLDQLRVSLANKHPETFWVKAQTKSDAHGSELFRYTDVVHTKGPLMGNVIEMFRLGHIELDYVLHEEFGANGNRKSRDHGYLFKMWQKNLPSLFPPPQKYSLV